MDVRHQHRGGNEFAEAVNAGLGISDLSRQGCAPKGY
jgi:hypothetical protein